MTCHPSVGLTRCRPPGLAGFRNVGQWRPLFPSPAFFHTQVASHHLPPAPAWSCPPPPPPRPPWTTPPPATSATPPCPPSWRMISATTTRRKKKKKTASSTSLASNTFQEIYRLTGEVLGQ